MSAELLAVLTDAVDGLLYPSESDEPFDVIEWPAVEKCAADEVARRSPGKPVSEVRVGDFFGDLAAADEASRFAELRKLLELNLRELTVVRAGDGAAVDVYILGRMPTGGWAGVHTVSVET